MGAKAEARERRIRELETALRALVVTEPLWQDREDWSNCSYCGGALSVYRKVGATFPHEEDCPWARARALLGE